MAPRWLSTLTGLVIIAAWSSSLALGAIERDWSALTITTPVMLLFAGYAFGVSIIRKQTNGHDKKKDQNAA